VNPVSVPGEIPRARPRRSDRVAGIVGPLSVVLSLAWMLRTELKLVGVLRRLFADDGPAGQVVRIHRFRNTADGPLVDGFGLTFVGWGGVMLAALQIALLATAVVAALVPTTRHRRWRIALMLGGVGIGVLWTGNSIWLLAWSFDVFSLVLTLVHVAGLLAMIVAMWWRCRADERVSRPS
jgi:hypothetical protein